MRFERRTGVSAVIATLLLVAITVTAAIIVYVFVGGLAGNLTQNGGQPVTEKLVIQSYNFQISPGSCGCSQQILEIFLFNPGPALTKVSAVYFDGVLLTLNLSPPTTDALLSGENNNWFPLPSATTMSSGSAGKMSFSSPAEFTSYSVTNVGQIVITFSSAASYGQGHTVKVVSTTGATNVYTVEAGISG